MATDIMEDPSADFLKEVGDYFDEHKSQKSQNRVARQSTQGKDARIKVTANHNAHLLFHPALYHGDTVALQTYVNNRWLGCAGSPCGGATCPAMLMKGSDWTNCWGEVFEIYRTLPGAVRVGDLVGLHYPRQRGHWLGCAGNQCGRATCPGHPTTAYGFASQDLWFRCYGEVFRIYARGKSSGSIINSDDNIALYYLQNQLWVAQGYDIHTDKRPCLGTSRPPALSVYDGCAFETFRIWKREY